MIALQRQLAARADRVLERQFSRLSLLNQLTRAIAEHQDLESILRVVLIRLVELLPVDAATVFLHDQAAGVFRIRMQETRADVPREHLGGGEGAEIPCAAMELRLCLEGQTIYRPDTAACAAPDLRHLARLGLRSGVAAPLAVGAQVLGVLSVLRRPVDAFLPEDVDFMRQLSEHVALAMNQALLQDSLKAACDELSTTQQAVLRQERLRALGQMASGIAHDINNALSPITLLPDILLQREPGLSEEGRKFLRTIQTAAADIEHTVARMREFYRQRDEQERLLPVDLNGVVHEVVDLTRPRWRDIPQQNGRTVRIETALDPNLPAIPGTSSELREALTNLILNAVDALPEGGLITVGTETTAAAAPSAGVAAEHCVTLWVRDTGVGMDEQTKLHCLEPFVTSKGERGTGLGLAMVYGIMQRHGATIEIDSAPGSGTTFRLTFPGGQSAGERTPDPAVDGASTAAEAMDLYRRKLEDGRPYTAVILDLNIPGGPGGLEVLALLRELDPAVKALVASGASEDPAVRDFRRFGFGGKIEKPFRYEDIAAALQALVGRPAP